MQRQLVSTTHSKGITQVELLVGMAVTLVLVAALAQMMVGVKSASSRMGQLSEAEQMAQIDMEFLVGILLRSGYRHDRHSALNDIFPATSGFTAGSVVRGTDHTLQLRYQSAGDASSRSCDGRATRAGGLVTEVLALDGGKLSCRSDAGEPGIWRTHVLGTEAEELQFSYGVDQDGDGAVDAYLPAQRVENWGQVLSVRVALNKTYSTVVALRNRLK